jgi:phosphatidylglycerophosphate synthase
MRYSVEQMRESYFQKRDWEKQFPVSYFVFRPLSFYLASFLTLFTNSPSKIAYLGLITGLAGSLALICINSVGIWPGIALLMLFALLDAADGNIARATGNVTYYGKFLDGAIGFIAESLYLPCLAAGLYYDNSRQYYALAALLGPGAGMFILYAGCAAMAALLYSSGLDNMYDFIKSQKEKNSGVAPASITAPIQSSRFRSNRLYKIFINLHAFNAQLVLLAAAACLRAADIFLLFFAAYYLARFIAVTAYYFGNERQ